MAIIRKGKIDYPVEIDGVEVLKYKFVDVQIYGHKEDKKFVSDNTYLNLDEVNNLIKSLVNALEIEFKEKVAVKDSVAKKEEKWKLKHK